MSETSLFLNAFSLCDFFFYIKIYNYILIIIFSLWCKADYSHRCLKALTWSKEILFPLLLNLGHFPYLRIIFSCIIFSY